MAADIVLTTQLRRYHTLEKNVDWPVRPIRMRGCRLVETGSIRAVTIVRSEFLFGKILLPMLCDETSEDRETFSGQVALTRPIWCLMTWIDRVGGF